MPYVDGINYHGDPSSVSPVSDVTIKDIHFDNFLVMGISVAASAGTLTISGNKITGGRNVDNPPYFNNMEYLVYAIHVSPNPSWWDPTDITGEVVIKNNVIDGRAMVSNPSDPEAIEYPSGTGQYLKGGSVGIGVSSMDAHAVISGNRIENIFYIGIQLFNYYGGVISSVMTVDVKENVIAHSPLGFGPTFSWSFPGILNQAVSNANIKGNTINHTHPNGAGIISFANENVIIKDNEVNLQNSKFYGIWLQDDTYESIVKENVINGSGRAAIGLGWPWYACENNTVQENDLSGFTPVAQTDIWGVTTHGAHIDLFWGAANNTIKNNYYALVDQNDDQLQNIYFAGPIPAYGLPGASGNTVIEDPGWKIMDFNCDPALYDPLTYCGANTIKLHDHD
jgi:hypothetical protein